MFAVKNRICDPPDPPDRRRSPRFEIKIKSGALHFRYRHISSKYHSKTFLLTISDSVFLYVMLFYLYTSMSNMARRRLKVS